MALAACFCLSAVSTPALSVLPQASPQLARLDAALAVLPADGRMVDVLIALPEALPENASRAGIAGIFARSAWVDNKRAEHARAGRELVAWLDAHGYRHRSYWIGNAVAARVPTRDLAVLAARADVRFVAGNPSVRGIDPLPAEDADLRAPNAIEWGVTRIRAPEAWAAGFLGQGMVVAGADTGYQWDHPALRNQYRGWNAQTQQASHAYNWHDAIHALQGGGTNPCGVDSTAPCDDNSHGTHTMGTMVGTDGGANQIGVAPQARWISCRNMDRGNGTPTTYLECMQFFAAPTDAAGNNPRADLAPHVINNSWGCPASEGCTPQTDVLMATAIENLHALGIIFVASAGNSGSACSSVSDPPATLQRPLTVGATGNMVPDNIASFSSRGPVGTRLAPSISAPGVSVRSSVPPSAYTSFSGTSMAGPHVAGAIALLLSSQPALASDPLRVRSLLETTAVPRTSAQDCGAFPGASVPNAVFGHGRVDVKAAIDAAAAEFLFANGFEG